MKDPSKLLDTTEDVIEGTTVNRIIWLTPNQWTVDEWGQTVERRDGIKVWYGRDKVDI